MSTDIKYEPHPPRNQGGQHVGIESGVKATHVSSGIVAIVNIGRSQHINKRIAENMILSAISHPDFK